MIDCECQKFFYNPEHFFGLRLVCAVCERVLIEPIAEKKAEFTEKEKVRESLEKDIQMILFQELEDENNRPCTIASISNLVMARIGKETDLLENQIKYLEEKLDEYSSPLDKGMQRI